MLSPFDPSDFSHALTRSQTEAFEEYAEGSTGQAGAKVIQSAYEEAKAWWAAISSTGEPAVDAYRTFMRKATTVLRHTKAQEKATVYAVVRFMAAQELRKLEEAETKADQTGKPASILVGGALMEPLSTTSGDHLDFLNDALMSSALLGIAFAKEATDGHATPGDPGYAVVSFGARFDGYQTTLDRRLARFLDLAGGNLQGRIVFNQQPEAKRIVTVRGSRVI